MFKRVLPPLANETINLLKDTSLVYVLAMNDILRITKSIVQRDFDILCLLGGSFVLLDLYLYFDKYLQLLRKKICCIRRLIYSVVACRILHPIIVDIGTNTQ